MLIYTVRCRRGFERFTEENEAPTGLQAASKADQATVERGTRAGLKGVAMSIVDWGKG
jgi:hypothetical protein